MAAYAPPENMNLNAPVAKNNLEVGEEYWYRNRNQTYKRFRLRSKLMANGRVRWLRPYVGGPINTGVQDPGPLRFYKPRYQTRGRNLKSLRLTMPTNEGTTAATALGMNNIRSQLGSFLSGEKGNLKQQQLKVHEKSSRPPGGPGVGFRRRRSTRKQRR